MKITSSLILPEQEHARYFDRELSWLSFNERVLFQYLRADVPLGEKFRFIAISANNLDEFYMVRIAGLTQLEKRGIHVIPKTEQRLDELLEHTLTRARKLRHDQLAAYTDVLSQFNDIGKIQHASDLNEKEFAWLKDWYVENILPLLSPTTIDPAHPFPFIQNKGKGLLIELTTPSKEPVRAVIILPETCQRFIRMPGERLDFVSTESAIMAFIDLIYPDHKVKKSGMFQILRDSEMQFDDEAEDLLSQFESSLKKRRRGNVISLMIACNFSKSTIKFLSTAMALDESQIIEENGLIALEDLIEIINFFPRKLLFQKWQARFPQRIIDFKGDCFAAIRHKDLLVHHPFESFDVVVKFLEQAADDPNVLAIRQTLYRTTSESPIAKALVKAAENGKSVTAVIELKARFDEANNIKLARALELAGAQVTYGLGDLKVHSKLSLVMRREGDSIKSYVHCGTGNYHPATSKVYTDLSFFTCDKKICNDIRLTFNFLTSYVQPENLSKVKISPNASLQWLLDCLDTEIENAKSGKPAFFWAKTNAIVETMLIEKLYDASNAGVNVMLVVRGICCLRPNVEGMSENITVISIVGRFLEHGRYYLFANGGEFGSIKNQIYMASADLMPRNLFNRVEIFLPLENQTVRKQILEQVVPAINEDNVNSWVLQSDGSYREKSAEDEQKSSHEYFMENLSLSGQGSNAQFSSNIIDTE